MTPSNFLKIATSLTKIVKNVKNSFLYSCQNVIEEKFLQEKYVSREEFNNLKSLMLDQQHKNLNNSKNQN